jgi:hypothetical protein
MASILLMGPSFFGYRDMVADEFRSMSHSVTTVVDRPSESVAFKSLGRVSYKLVDSRIAAHAAEVERTLAGGSFDFLVYLSGMSFCFTREQFGRMRAASGARFVAGLWDAFGNCQRLGACRDLFDDVYSFEPRDCERYGLKLRPLFYSNAYTGLPLVPEGGFEWDACFIGSVHQRSKFRAVKRTCDGLKARGLRVFEWYYMPSKSAEALRKAQDPAYRGVEFKHEALSPAQVADVYARSKAVVDSPQAGQSGLTIRTMETLGARRKLITANADVRSYDFYRCGGVAVTSPGGGADGIPDDFFDRPYEELPGDVYESYSLRAFARALLGEGPAYSGYRKAIA